MGLERAADGMILPLTAGPVNDEDPADYLEAEREEEKSSPATTHLA